MGYQIIHLPKEKWQGYPLPIRYETDRIYDVSVERTGDGFQMSMQLKKLDKPVVRGAEGSDYPDKLYEEWWPEACAWGVIEGEKLIAAIETCPENWSNRLRVTELWVHPDHQKKGIGRALMNVAKEQARLERRRAIMLETQSGNVSAIGFYLHEGFTLIGFDACCYTNQDLQRGDVRIELGWLRERRRPLSREEIDIRKELPGEERKTEEMTRRAFFNKYRQGCDEHYLIHVLRKHEDYLPELSRVAVKDGKIIGAVFYSKSRVMDGDVRHDMITFGPLCVEPEWQGTGVGEMLLRETLPLAAEAGYPGVIIFGEPDYYPRVGFRTNDHFGITTAAGKNFPAFMGYELRPGSMEGIHGKFYESEAFEHIVPEEAERFDEMFPPMERQYFPKQW